MPAAIYPQKALYIKPYLGQKCAVNLFLISDRSLSHAIKKLYREQIAASHRIALWGFQGDILTLIYSQKLH